jgi:hypothetical protein
MARKIRKGGSVKDKTGKQKILFDLLLDKTTFIIILTASVV